MSELAEKQQNHEARSDGNQKYCKHCGKLIDKECVICPHCGKQVEQLSQGQPNIVIQNTNTNTNINAAGRRGKRCSKWTAFFLCLFLGFWVHTSFMKEKPGRGFFICLHSALRESDGSLILLRFYSSRIRIMFKSRSFREGRTHNIIIKNSTRRCCFLVRRKGSGLRCGAGRRTIFPLFARDCAPRSSPKIRGRGPAPKNQLNTLFDIAVMGKLLRLDQIRTALLAGLRFP